MSTIFIGDIHGCAQELEQLLDEAGYAQGDDRLLLTGDAFSRGPLPLRVWEIIGETRAEMVLGNHDDRLMRQLKQKLQDEEAAVSWKNQVSTLEQLAPVAEQLLNWLEQVPLCLDEDDFLLVHAGINPVAGMQGTSRQEFLTIRTWPPVEDVVGPRWHDALGIDSCVLPVIIFGHDAPGGLVVKKARGEDRPYLLGLDSGCVHGNALSAYILEENRIVQVASRQPRRH